jgi:DNA-binding MurR/RpiR family transcriptional regulator
MKKIFIRRHAMESILHKIRFSFDSMGPAEKRIADYLLSHSGELVDISITELAQRCDCGDATIVRFSRRLGLSGYQELKLRIAVEMNASSSVSAELKKTDSCFDIFRKRINDISASLCNTESVLDADALERAAHAIGTADRIVIFGLGNSAAIAQDAAHKFLRLGLSAQACCDNHMQAIIASHMKRGSVAIGVSHSGSSKDIVEAMQLSRACGATNICVTNHGSSPIVEVSDICLFTKSDETKYSVLAMSSRIAQLTIFDSIYTYIVLNSDKPSRQAIYNTEMSLERKKY